MKQRSFSSLFKLSSTVALCLGLSACDWNFFKSDDAPQIGAEQITKLIPSRVQKREAWSKDVEAVMMELNIPRTVINVCTVIAVVDQESNFHADPVVYGLGEKAVKEVNERLEEKFEAKLGENIGGTVAGYFQNVLKNQPSPDNNFLSQMRKVRTEQELDKLYREIFDHMAKTYHVSAVTGAAKLIGQDIAEKMNPITTLGSMQVHISYAKEHKRQMGGIEALRDDLYTQYGGLYYGIHRLMKYEADYDKPLYRFADYNSGMYSSRNAAFQDMLNTLYEGDLDLDGDLLLYNKNGQARIANSQSERALLQVFNQYNIVITQRQIRTDLKKEKTKKFEETQTYLAVKKLYQEQTHKQAPYAIMPKVVISGPKLSRDYNTNWFATRVNGRYDTCMRQAKRLKFPS